MACEGGALFYLKQIDRNCFFCTIFMQFSHYFVHFAFFFFLVVFSKKTLMFFRQIVYFCMFIDFELVKIAFVVGSA